jgi:hypothetical protein
VAEDLASHVAAERAFSLDDSGTVVAVDSAGDALGHGTALARIILAAAPDAELLVARIFDERMVTQPAVAAAGLDWLVGEGARMVNMSFGLRHDRGVLREACARAVSAGAILLGAAAARGAAVYPSAYPGVIRVSGDARCAPDELSTLGGGQADFGAHPRPSQGFTGAGPDGGASFAVPHVCTVIAAYLAERPEADRDAVWRRPLSRPGKTDVAGWLRGFWGCVASGGWQRSPSRGSSGWPAPCSSRRSLAWRLPSP